MHGFIFSELKKYVTHILGDGVWDRLLLEAGFAARSYENFQDYPDDEITTLVATASRMTKLPAADIVEGFGEFIAKDLVEVFRPLIDPAWRTLEFLENAESVIHRVVRSRNPKARPPALSCARVGPHEVVLTYGSKRKLCALAKGIVRGAAAVFEEEVTLNEEVCMLRGDRVCVISVRLLGRLPAPARQRAEAVGS